MQKLEQIYSCFTGAIVKDISAFWLGYDIQAKNLAIDTDSMQGIVIYLVSRSNQPQLLAEVYMGEAYLARAVKKSSRFIYFEMLTAACNFILDLEPQYTSYMMSLRRATEVQVKPYIPQSAPAQESLLNGLISQRRNTMRVKSRKDLEALMDSESKDSQSSTEETKFNIVGDEEFLFANKQLNEITDHHKESLVSSMDQD